MPHLELSSAFFLSEPGRVIVKIRFISMAHKAAVAALHNNRTQPFVLFANNEGETLKQQQ